MQTFEQLSQQFADYFNRPHFPDSPASLYEPNTYFLGLGGKRVRPVCCLMGNELFEAIHPDAWHAATAVELFHNFTLIHDDIMDQAPLRRGQPTVHVRNGTNTALLAGDVMLVKAYEELEQVRTEMLPPLLRLFNKTAREVCEGQQWDMDFEKSDEVTLESYLRMIELKTSVLLAASLQMGALIGGAGQRNQELLYEFGRKLGIAFQVQDDYLDAFGDPAKFGKQVGGDILANKKTFLWLHARETANAAQLQELKNWEARDGEQKVAAILDIYRACGVDAWALELKNKYLDEALAHLDDIAVLSRRKDALAALAGYLIQREH